MNFLKKLLIKLSYFTAGDKTFDYYNNFFMRNLSLSADDIKKLQDNLIQKLICHAYNHTEYYKSLMDSLDLKPADIQTASDLKKLPPLTKDTVKTNIDKISSDDKYGKKLITVTSSGSTGNVGLVYKSPYYYQMNYAAFLRNFSVGGVDFWSDKALWLWTIDLKNCSIVKKIKKFLSFVITRRIIIDTESYGEREFREYIKLINKNKPKMIFGKGSVILPLAEYIIENGIKINCVKSVFPCSTHLLGRDVIEKAFNAKVYDFYSACEIYGIAVECAQNVFLVADDNVVINISDQGEFFITALHSYGFPLINYQIGDYGIELDRKKSIQSKINFSAMNLKLGRIVEMFLRKDGRFVSASNILVAFANAQPHIRQQQIIQTDYDKFIFNYVPVKPFDNDYLNIVINKLKNLFGDNIDVKINKVDEIQPEKSGKHLYFKRTFKLEKSFLKIHMEDMQ